MKNLTPNPDDQRFRSGADKYAAYLDTPEGRLRLNLTFANLQESLPRNVPSLRALDVGGGTGAIAIRLAQLGVYVTLLDSSQPMLDMAIRNSREAGVTESITLKHGDAGQLSNLFPRQSFDVILCHNILEYVDDPCAVLRSAARMLRDSASIISVLARNQAGEALKSAIKDGDLGAAENNLTAEWTYESLYGGKVRLFTSDGLRAMLAAAPLELITERGVRVISDYLPQKISRTTEYTRIFELERKLGARAEFVSVARYTHVLAHRPGPAMKGSA